MNVLREPEEDDFTSTCFYLNEIRVSSNENQSLSLF